MLYESENTLLLNLATILSGTQVDTNAVTKALTLICGGISFESGFVYEADASEHLCLMEHYQEHPSEVHNVFPISELTVEEQDELSKNTVTFITENSGNSLLEKHLLTLHNAKMLVLAPVLDESMSIYGLVVFSDSSAKCSFSEADQIKLTALLSLLVRYVGVRMYQQKFKQARTTLESILDNTGIDIYVNDFYNHDILYVNKSMAAPYGGAEQFIGRKCWQVLFPGQRGPCDFCPQTKLLDIEGNPTKVYSWDYQRPFDGSWFRVFSGSFHWIDGRLAHVVSSADITDNKRNEALIENLANYDQLTRLPNRRMLVQECEHRIDNATATEKGYLLFFDIDGFKSINDTWGHDAGDDFLIQLGEFFSSVPMLKDSTYRNGGDEFVAIIGGEDITKSNIRNLASFIYQRFRKPWHLKKGDAFCSTSIGVACYPEDGTNAEQLLHKADKAMYQVKKNGGNGICFGYELKDDAL